MSPSPLVFADASSTLDEAFFVVFGVPLDHTASYRPGARFAPRAIRECSFNFETYNMGLDTDLRDVPVHDMGDVEEAAPRDMLAEARETSRRIASMGKIPLALGGEHSITPHVLGGLADGIRERGERADMLAVVFDAHLDYRREYLGDRESHACAVRRMAEILGEENVRVVGIRSADREELREAKAGGLVWHTPEEAEDMGVESLLESMLEETGAEKVYLSLDIDAIDPAYAPGTGTPEPFGLHPRFVRDSIRYLAPWLVGMDVVEVCPPADNGNTSSLAARLIREFLGAVFLHSKR
ncbi:MAG: agmatinase [Thermoplasmata archaeon]|nr:agmatinase [Thermoplasmata archaeon]